MAKVCIVSVYFGKLPEYFSLWLNSCRNNPTIDFLFISDQSIVDLPQNIRQINMSFEQFKIIVQQNFEFPISLERPYKICDFRPVFGLIFAEYLKKYEFWGHCDMDMIFGDLRNFITEKLLDCYDKILPLGHLSLYRNTEECNNRFKLRGSQVGEYKEVFTSNKGFAFDELGGIYQIYKKNNFTMYDKRVFADISEIYKRFKLALTDKNYNLQIFSYDNGKVIRTFFQKGVFSTDEFAYIHIKKPKFLAMKLKPENYNHYFITNSGFYPKDDGVTLDDIRKLNPYKGFVIERSELINYKIKSKGQRLLNKSINILKGI